MGPLASLGLAFSRCVSQPLLPFSSRKLAVGFGLRPLTLPSSSLTHTSSFWGEGCKTGMHGLLEIIKIYASVCKHTFKSWRFPSTLVYLNSRASWISSLSVVCLCHRQAANGRASRRCALCISLLPPPHTEGSVRPRNTNHPACPHPPHSRPVAARLLTHWRHRDGEASWGGGARRQSRVVPEGEWERVKVPWIRPLGFLTLAPAPSFAPGCDLPETQPPRATHLCA